ncbi:MAG: response regulator [Bacteroidales bacterium]|nr:response regulator [Bacteroidales bacterium]
MKLAIIKLKLFITLLLMFELLTAQSSNDIAELETMCVKYEQAGNQIELAKTQTKLGFLYRDKGNYRQAIEWFKKAITTNEKLGNYNAIKVLNTNIGYLQSEMNNYDEAIESFKQSLKLNEKYNKKPDIVQDLINIALAQQGKQNYNESNNNLSRALSLAQELNDLKALKTIYGMLSENSEKLGRPDKAKEYFELASSLRNMMQKEELKRYEDLTKKAEAEVNAKEAEKRVLSEELDRVNTEKELTLKLLEQEKELRDLREKEFQAKERIQKAHQQVTNIILASLVFIILLISLFLFVIFKQLRKIKIANAMLSESHRQVAEQKQEIEKQHAIVTEQKKKLTDSIMYAQRIQNAVLPPRYVFEKIFPQHFILFKPRDIVSGDFYWISSKDNISVIAVADCTGHGVPGAFMSMLGIAFLNEIVSKMTINRHIVTFHASDILNELRNYVIQSLHQTGRPTESKDGMDIALCVIDFENKTMEFAGAHNPAYLIRNGELQVIEADRMPIGIYKSENKSFTNREIKLEYNDQIYLFSDGFYDQIGGPKRMKMLSVNFRKYLLDICNLPMSEQQKLLEEYFESWRGDNEQLDDVLVLGIKYTQHIIPSASTEYQWSGKNILIAEDVDINYFLLVEALKKTNANIVRALNGKEAVELCKKQHFDLILMDIRMPEMDGIEATKEIRKFNPVIPIVAQTAFGDENDIQRILAAGCNAHISKPINLKNFLSVIKKHLNL